MSAPISPIAPISLPQAAQPVSLKAASAASGFQQVLESALSHVANTSTAASDAVASYMVGGNQELHSTILATQNASLDLELLLQVRNKLVSAYDEIMKSQI